MNHTKMKSMTAFARSEGEHGNTRLIWEVRSVNHRYLDTHLKLPEEWRVLETESRALVAKKLNRGRIDAQLKVEHGTAGTEMTTVNPVALENLGQLFDQIRMTIPDAGPASLTEILKWPGMIAEPTRDTEALQAAGMAIFDEALDMLIGHRQREGERLGELMSDRIAQCQALVDNLSNNLEEISQSQTAKWQKRIETLCQEPDNQRLHQEIAIILTKSDISEEIDRLNTHFTEVRRTLSQNKPAGRRLDFLMQELNREANTWAPSPSTSASPTLQWNSKS